MSDASPPVVPAVGDLRRRPMIRAIVVVSASSYFAALLLLGPWLGVIENGGSAAGRGMVALVAACLSVPLSEAFRDVLWWSVGTTAAAADLEHLVLLNLLAAVLLGAVAFAVPRPRVGRPA